MIDLETILTVIAWIAVTRPLLLAILVATIAAFVASGAR